MHSRTPKALDQQRHLGPGGALMLIGLVEGRGLKHSRSSLASGTTPDCLTSWAMVPRGLVFTESPSSCCVSMVVGRGWGR